MRAWNLTEMKSYGTVKMAFMAICFVFMATMAHGQGQIPVSIVNVGTQTVTPNPTQLPALMATVIANQNSQLTALAAMQTQTVTATPNAAANNYQRFSELAVETAVAAISTQLAGGIGVTQSGPVTTIPSGTAVPAVITPPPVSGERFVATGTITPYPIVWGQATDTPTAVPATPTNTPTPVYTITSGTLSSTTPVVALPTVTGKVQYVDRFEAYNVGSTTTTFGFTTQTTPIPADMLFFQGGAVIKDYSPVIPWYQSNSSGDISVTQSAAGTVKWKMWSHNQ